MNPFEAAVSEFRVKWLLNRVIEAGGSVSAAARNTGVHRNTFSRALLPAGYTPRRIRAFVRQQRGLPPRKGPKSVGLQHTHTEIRRTA